MNSVKKLYCRAFQTVFKLSIPIMPYRKPEILGSVKDIPGIVKNHGLSKMMVVTDQGITGLGLTREMEDALKCSGIDYVIYDKTNPNPTTDNVEEALGL